MTLYNHTDSNIALRAFRTPMSWLLTVLFCVGLVFSQTLPTFAMLNSGDRMEICGEHGAETIHIDLGHSDQPAKCTHCENSLVQAQEFQAKLPYFHDVNSSQNTSILRFSVSAVRMVNDPEHYWSHSRGPPNGNKNNTMNPIAHIIPADQMMAPQKQLGAS